jgi:HlyD family secretion protein
MMMRRKAWIPIVLVVVASGGYAAYRLSSPSTEDVSEVRVSGNIELREVDIAFPAGGQLVYLAVEEGDPVRRGDVIARLDTEELEEQRARASAALASARSRLRQLEAAIALRNEQVAGEIQRASAELDRATATLEELESGARPQEIEVARAAAASAAGEFERAQRDWERSQTLYEDEDISTAQFDEARSRFEVATARLDEARERQALVEEGPRREDIAAAGAEVDRARANLRLAEAGRLEVARMREEIGGREAEIRLSEAELAIAEARLADGEAVSPIDGIVLVKAAEVGEIVPAAAPVVTVGDIAHPWLRAYINETELGRVEIGAEVPIETDSFPGRVYMGRLSFIASEAEFTPNQIQTDEERVRLVYRIRIDVENPDGELKSNMPADGRVPLIPAD